MVIPPVLPEEREELRLVYLQIRGLHDKTFEQCLEIPLVLGCLRNTAEAVRRARAARAARPDLNPENFQLTP